MSSPSVVAFDSDSLCCLRFAGNPSDSPCGFDSLFHHVCAFVALNCLSHKAASILTGSFAVRWVWCAPQDAKQSFAEDEGSHLFSIFLIFRRFVTSCRKAIFSITIWLLRCLSQGSAGACVLACATISLDAVFPCYPRAESGHGGNQEEVDAAAEELQNATVEGMRRK